MKIGYLTLSLSLAFFSCMNNENSVEDQLIGKWQGELYQEDVIDNEVVSLDTIFIESEFLKNNKGTISGYSNNILNIEWNVRETQVEKTLSLNTESTFFTLTSGFDNISILESTQNVQCWLNVIMIFNSSNPDGFLRSETWKLTRVN